MAEQIASKAELSKQDWLRLKEVTVYAGFAHDVYTRQCLREGKFDEPTAPYKEQMKGFQRWQVARESVDHYLQNRASRTSGRRFILKMDLGMEELVRGALDKVIGADAYELSLSYKKKESAKDSK